MTVLWDIVETALARLIAIWVTGYTRKKDVNDAIEPYKAEAEALAAPIGSKSANIHKLREDIELLP